MVVDRVILRSTHAAPHGYRPGLIQASPTYMPIRSSCFCCVNEIAKVGSLFLCVPPLLSFSSLHPCTLLPGQPEHPINCTITFANTGDGTAYEAFTYAWGDEADESFIICNNMPVKSRNNLESALQHLRIDIARTLWVGCMCIDKNNLEKMS